MTPSTVLPRSAAAAACSRPSTRSTTSSPRVPTRNLARKVHFTNAPVLRNFIAGVSYFHNDYTNQEIDVETALGVEETSGGNSTYHGVDAFFDADPSSNLHFFFNFAAESANFTTYVTGGPIADCGTPANSAASSAAPSTTTSPSPTSPK